MPFDAFVQFERQPYAVLVPAPARGEIGDDRGHAVLLHVLVVHDEVVEHPHDRPQRVDRHLLVDRQARRAVDRVRFQYPTLLLSTGGRGPREKRKQRAGCGKPLARWPPFSSTPNWTA